jgi:FkbM family methyltransferase
VRNLVTSWTNRFRNTGGQCSSFEEIERAERIFFLEYLQRDMTVFDVGANVGELTLIFSRFIGAGKVHAFEASESTYERLVSVCTAADLHNVVLNRLALGEAEGTVKLHIYDQDHRAWNSRAARPLENYGIDIKPVSVEDVPASTVDIYCERNNISKINLLKIDVEGAEFQVLLGANKMLTDQRIDCIVFEFGQTTFDMGNDPTAIENYLTSKGYHIRNLMEGEPVFPGRAGALTAQFSMHVATPKT